MARFQNIRADVNISAPRSPVRMPHGANRSAIVARVSGRRGHGGRCIILLGAR